MTAEGYLLFVAGSVLLVLSPGPDMAYLLARCLAQGRRAGMVAALGFNAGGYVHLAAALAASPRAFAAVVHRHRGAGGARLSRGHLRRGGKGAMMKAPGAPLPAPSACPTAPPQGAAP